MPRHAPRNSVLILSIAGLLVQAPPVTGQSSAAPPEFQLPPDVGSRLAEAAQDSTLAPWQREFMLGMALGGPERGAVESPPALPGSALAPVGPTVDDGTWTAVPPPTWRERHTAIYDPVRDRMVVFGGVDAISFRSDVWALSLGGSPAWSEISPAGSPPSGRMGHAAIYDPVRDRMVVFGGGDGSNNRNDVWALSLGGSPAWSEITPAGSPPSGRVGHTVIYDPARDRMVVFGGWDSSILRNDVWVLALSVSPAWSALAPEGSPPSRLIWHTAIYDAGRDRMVVFGGFDGDNRHNDVLALSLGASPAWAALAPAGSPPSARDGHTAIYDAVRDRMVVFGGWDGRRIPDDVWALSLSGSPAWSTFAPAGPTGRSRHSAIYDAVRDRMVVFGGLDGRGYPNDVWALSLSGSPAWSALAPVGPTGRLWHTAIYDPARDRMVVFGGHDGVRRNDAWALSLSTSQVWNEVVPAGSHPAGRYGHTAIYDPVRDRMVVFGGWDAGFFPRNDVWGLSLAGSPTWSELTPTGIPPSERYFHTAIYDPVRDRMVVFGGLDEYDIRNDVWALSLAGSPAWSELVTAGSPPSRRVYHTAIYDPLRDRMVVFGGSDNIGSRSDVWALSLAGSPAWSAIAPGGSPPSARYLHTAIYDPVRDRMVVFGGYDGFYCNDLWALSLAGSPAWSALAPVGNPPSGRRQHTAIYDPMRNRMAVFGGNDGSLRNDVWTLDWATPPVSALVSLAHAEAGPDRVSLTWYGSESAGLTGSVERREVTTEWQRLATISADGTGTFRFDDRAVAPGARYAYRLAYRDDGGAETVTAETWVDVPVTVSLALEGLRPNPAGAELTAVFTLPDDAPAVLAVLDITGRRVLAREVGSLGAGRHTLRLGHAGELATGIYWLRLERLGHALKTKAIVLR